MTTNINQQSSPDIIIPLGNISLHGILHVPASARGIILFSHGSGSSRLSSRNRMVARFLENKNLGTLLFDLLTEEEDEDYDNRFDIHLLSSRLIGATQWMKQHVRLPFGFFGASTGAASALQAAAALPETRAVVSRGGRPDLVMDNLALIKAPTLLIVGSLDPEVLELNRQAYTKLRSEKSMEIVKGATHLFEEPGKMDMVCDLAAAWFDRYF